MRRPRATLPQIRQEALANTIEIGWDVLEADPEHRADFEKVLSQCAVLLPEIEALYSKLAGVLADATTTSISHEDRELFLDTLEDELCATYQVIDLWERYRLIENITALDNRLP
jgi:hypothetical protein